ncbi:multicopper oxidase [Paecilomyces variotii No. 5]|uniref:Multicopper oxidase n=1 Tax=Byssochlamys spectabilis (strain No. 5 / NBRC 109023) TaxID=1356009 RepID=V5FUS9_BYSSN|nr:multicopper oxidase [Paecilomyces variotii No. 5]
MFPEFCNGLRGAFQPFTGTPTVRSPPLMVLLVALLALLSSARCATVTYDFNITWVASNPDGAHERPTIGINGQWPLPTIAANVGDRIIVNVLNQLGNQSTSLHFHGLFMKNASHMDGPDQVTQCGIPPGYNFQYNFTVDQPGTYWYHSHTQSQYPDGLRGPLIIYDEDSPFKGKYEEELILPLSDWYHDEMSALLPTYMVMGNMMLQEPLPQSNLINETQNLKIEVQPGKTYLVRVINMGAFMGQYFWMEGHNMTVVELDGVYTKPTDTDTIYLATGQRCSFLLRAKDDRTANYPMVASLDPNSRMGHGHFEMAVTGWLVYDSSLPYPEPEQLSRYDSLDDMALAPYDEQPLLTHPDRTITLTMNMDMDLDGITHWLLNDISYAPPEVPTLYTALTSGADAANETIYATSTNPFVLEKDSIVELIVNNEHMGRHPFHLHGHHFQAVFQSKHGDGLFIEQGLTEDDLPRTPIRRDTLVVNPGGSIVVRFRANNPGIWIFHCHMEWHAHAGLIATMVEDPLTLQERTPMSSIPSDHLRACSPAQIPLTSNNDTNWDVSHGEKTENTISPAEKEPPAGPITKPSYFKIAAFIFYFCSIALACGAIFWFMLRKRRPKTEDVAYKPVTTTEPGEEIEM